MTNAISTISKRSHITVENVDQMRKLRNEGRSNLEIAKTLDLDPRTVAFHIGKSPRNNGRRVTKEEEKRMRELREQGLSNNQIAIEMKMSWETVTNHIGKQPKGNRSKYGSIVSHADGESFVHDIPTEPFRPCSARVAEEEKEPAWVKEIKAVQKSGGTITSASNVKPANGGQKAFGLQTLSNVAVYQGQDLRYKINSSGQIAIWEKEEREETAIQLTFDQFNKMLEEMLQLIDKIPD